MTRSAPFTASAACTQPRSMRRRPIAVSIVALVRAEPVMVPASPFLRMAWLIEEPMSPIPISATCSNIGAGLRPGLVSAPSCGGSLDEIGKRGDHCLVVGLRPHRYAQGIGQTIGVDASHNDGARLEERVRGVRAGLGTLGKVHQQEIGDARRHLEAQLLDLGCKPRQPARVVLGGGLHVLHVLHRRSTRRISRAPDTLKGPRMRFRTSATASGQ